MASLYAHMMNLVFRCMPQDKPEKPHDYAAERKRNDRKPPRPPRGVTVRLGELGGLPAEFIQKTGNRKRTVFYIHGGGFTVGSARERRAVCQYIAANYGYNCVSFNYRLAPEDLWPAPLDDCLTASDTEVLADDARALYEKLRADNHRTALDIRHGVCHGFQVFPAMPEARQTLAAIFRVLEGWA